MMEPKKTSLNIDRYESIVRVIFILIIILGSLIISFLIISSISSPEGTKSGYVFSAPGIEVSINDDNISGPVSALSVETISLIILFWALLIFSFYQFRKILQSTRENKTPFIFKNIKRIRYIGYSFFAYAVTEFGIECIMSAWLSKLILTGAESVKLYSKLSLPLWPLLVGVIILCIAQFFSYGFKLQQDNDSIV